MVLVSRYYGQEGCLSSFVSDGRVIRREEARGALEQSKRREPLLIKRLESDPLAFGDLTLESAAEELEILSMYPGRKVRSLACASLKRSFPLRQVESCKAVSGE